MSAGSPRNQSGSLIRNAGIIGAATLLSRLLGFVRDMVTASYLGTSIYADAFFVAFRIPNLLRRLFGEGSLTAAFIPVFATYLAAGKRQEAREIAQTAMTLTALCLTVVTLLGILFSPVIISLIAPGFADTPEKYEIAVFLNRLMFPYILLISLVALAMGILNADGHFLTPALAPVLLNLCMIGAALGLSRVLGNPALALAVGVLAGGLAQLLMQLPVLKKHGFPWRLRFHFRHPAIKRVIVLMGPSLLGLAITQITIFVNTLLASYLADGSISFLYFADRLIQFPLGIFAVALGTAVLPALSRAAAGLDWHDFSDTLSLALRLLMFITLPAMAGLIMLSKPIVFLLFQRGHFGAHSTDMVSQTIIAYACGLWAYAGLRIIVPAFHSLQDTKTPVKVGAIALISNLICAVGLMPYLQHLGLALATAIASAVNCLLLLAMLKKRLGPDIQLRGCGRAFGQSLLATTTMVIIIMSLDRLPLITTTYHSHLEESLRLAIRIIFGLAAYFLCARLLHSPELSELQSLLTRRRRKAATKPPQNPGL
ncbi:MAG: murein biosynthesis integral membrane protein MurJ [Deltaproteobacteria bacterium]|nr:murein biosynthesis integral membrane protein MurJ [Deltaproteobacteria bacterium]